MEGIILGLFSAAVSIAIGGGMLMSVESVLSNRHAPGQAARRQGLRVFGAVLLGIGVLTWLLFLAALAMWFVGGERIFDNIFEVYAAVAGVALFSLIPLAGWMLLTVGRLIIEPRSSELELQLDKRLDGLTVIGWIWVGLGILQIAVTVIGAIPLLLIGVIFFALGRRRSARQDELLWILAIAAEKNMPLAPAVEAFAAQCRGRFRGRVFRLANLLNAGLSLPDAVDCVPRILPESAKVAARVGWESGALGQALKEESVRRTLQRPIWHTVAARLVYLFTVLIWTQAVAGFVLYFIAPKFKKIFNDFGVELPMVTRLVTDMGDRAVQSLMLPLLMVGELGVFLFLVVLFLRGGSERILFGGLIRRLNTSVILRALALGVDAGQPLTVSIGTLAKSYPRWGIRERLVSALASIGHGTRWHSSLLDEGLIRPTEAAVLESAERAGNLSWALREMAESSERRLSYRLQLAGHVLFPLVVVCLGGLVLVFVASYFLPLVKLIMELSG